MHSLSAPVRSAAPFNVASWRERLAQQCPTCDRFIRKLKELWLVQEMVKVAKLAVPIVSFFLSVHAGVLLEAMNVLSKLSLDVFTSYY